MLLIRRSNPSSADRIVAVVSDVARNCFYTLTAKNAISVYRPNGDKSIQHIQTIANLYKAAQDKAPGSPALTPQSFQIISLHVIEQSESRSGVQLLAITSNGVRLYFSPSYGYQYGSGTSSTPGARSLQLVHVRLPPPNLIHPDELLKPYRPPIHAYGSAPPKPTSRPYIVSTLENSCYIEGLTVAAQPGDTDGTDFLLCMAPDLTRIGSLGQLNLPANPPPPPPQQPAYNGSYNSYGGASTTTNRIPLTEYATLLAIPGRTWAMAVVPRTASSSTPPGAPAPVVTNELATQFSESPRQFMILTNVGLTFLVKRRALDYLKATIEEVHSEGNVQPIIEFRDRYCRISSRNTTGELIYRFTALGGTRPVQCYLVWLVATRFWMFQTDLLNPTTSA